MLQIDLLDSSRQMMVCPVSVEFERNAAAARNNQRPTDIFNTRCVVVIAPIIAVPCPPFNPIPPSGRLWSLSLCCCHAGKALRSPACLLLTLLSLPPVTVSWSVEVPAFLLRLAPPLLLMEAVFIFVLPEPFRRFSELVEVEAVAGVTLAWRRLDA